MTPILQVKNLVKKYGALLAVDDISFSIPRGICFGLLGPNGAGKTTALETIENIKKPTSGEILYKGETRNGTFQNEVGIQFQETSLLSLLRVKETLEIFQKLYRSSHPLDYVISLCGLEEILQQYNDKISGGQKQRLMLALAIINDPELIFLDEPSTGMDPQNRRNLWKIIRSIKNNDKTIILTTHYMEEASLLCDDVAIMDHGKIIAQGAPESLIRKYTKHASIIIPNDGQMDLPQCAAMKVFQLEGFIEIQTDDINQCIKDLLLRKINLSEMTVRSANLEDVFIHLTGRRLRE
jgi:ABC-2 type transport system ATP-binding protein